MENLANLPDTMHYVHRHEKPVIQVWLFQAGPPDSFSEKKKFNC